MRSGRFVHDVRDGKPDGPHIQRLPVMKRDSVAQLDPIGQRVLERERLRQQRLELAFRSELHQRVVDRVDDRPPIGVIRRRRVERDRPCQGRSQVTPICPATVIAARDTVRPPTPSASAANPPPVDIKQRRDMREAFISFEPLFLEIVT